MAELNAETWSVKELNLVRDDVDSNKWPKLSCGAATLAYLDGRLQIGGEVESGINEKKSQLMIYSSTPNLGHGEVFFYINQPLSVGGEHRLLTARKWNVAKTEWRDWLLSLREEGEKQEAGLHIYRYKRVPGDPTKDDPRSVLFLGEEGTVYVHNDLRVNQNIHCPKWNITTVCHEVGPLPKSKPFGTAGGTLLFLMSGSGWCSDGGIVGMTVTLNSNPLTKVWSATNEMNSHKAFVSNTFKIAGVPQGQQTLGLEPLPGTQTDGNDFFSVTVLEFPF